MASRKGKVGLENLGNTCFANAALQCLAHSTSFRKEFVFPGPIAHNRRAAAALREWLDFAWSPRNTFFSPDDLLNAVARVSSIFAGNSQQDSHEFLRCLLGTLPDEAVDPFKGRLVSTLICQICGTPSRTEEDMFDLSLSIPTVATAAPALSLSFLLQRARVATVGEKSITLDSCLKSFFAEETLCARDMFTCEKCKRKVEGTKSLKLLKAPELLCVQLKRFKFEHGSWFSSGSKNSRQVAFPVEDNLLDLCPFMHPDSPHGGADPLYKLYAMVQHSGSLSGGHYVAYCLNNADRNWYLFDDSRVTRVTSDRVATSEGYLLFYYKIPPPSLERDRFLLSRGCDGDSAKVYLPTAWIRRFKFRASPGAIQVPKDLICPHSKIGVLTEVKATRSFKEVNRDLAEQLRLQYGGDKGLEKIEMCEECKQLIEADNKRRTLEGELVPDYDTRELPDGESAWYLVSQAWVVKWKRYIDSEPSETIGQMLSNNCGPVDNEVIAKGGDLKIGKDFSAVNSKVWKLFMHFHGGGPIVMRNADMTIPIVSNEVVDYNVLPPEVDVSTSWRVIDKR